MLEMSKKKNKNKKVVEEAVEESLEEVARELQEQQRPLVPGYEQICGVCVFKDFYTTFKNSNLQNDALQRQQVLVQNLQNQLQAATTKLEELAVFEENAEE